MKIFEFDRVNFEYIVFIFLFIYLQRYVYLSRAG